LTGDDVEAFPEGEAAVELEARVHLIKIILADRPYAMGV
jgi:hypothetical protein